jgi:hypothetical protein
MHFKSHLFQGFKDSEPNDDSVILLPPEQLEVWYWIESHRTELREASRDRAHRRINASFILRLALLVLAALLLIGVVTQSFRAAEIWWAAMGPLVGYLIRILFEQTRRNVRSTDGHEKTQTPVRLDSRGVRSA